MCSTTPTHTHTPTHLLPWETFCARHSARPRVWENSRVAVAAFRTLFGGGPTAHFGARLLCERGCACRFLLVSLLSARPVSDLDVKARLFPRLDGRLPPEAGEGPHWCPDPRGIPHSSSRSFPGWVIWMLGVSCVAPASALWKVRGRMLSVRYMSFVRSLGGASLLAPRLHPLLTGAILTVLGAPFCLILGNPTQCAPARTPSVDALPMGLKESGPRRSAAASFGVWNPLPSADMLIRPAMWSAAPNNSSTWTWTPIRPLQRSLYIAGLHGIRNPLGRPARPLCHWYRGAPGLSGWSSLGPWGFCRFFAGRWALSWPDSGNLNIPTALQP